MADDRWVLTFACPGHEEAAALYEEAKKLPGAHQAALVERDAENVLQVPESWVHRAGVPTVGAGLAGGLIGLVGGPLGALIGWVAGSFAGGAVETERFRHAAEALAVLGVDVPDRGHAVLVEAREEDPAPADGLAARHGVRLTRRPAQEVQAGVQKAEDHIAAEAEEEKEKQRQGE